MAVIPKPERLDAFLPATPVTEETRRQVEELSKREGVSKAHIMRSALSFFLSQVVNKADINSEYSSLEKGDEQQKQQQSA